MRCECDAKKMRECGKKNSSAMQCDANFDSIFASHSHFAVFRIFCIFALFFVYFAHFFRTFHNFLVHQPWNVDQKGGKSAKKKCKKCDANAKCKCDAKKVPCDAMSFSKKC